MDDPRSMPAFLDGGWRQVAFQPFREGVEIFPICEGAPAVALLRYAAGARVPMHRHAGLETILVLEGAQSDERGRYPAGSFCINPEGSCHSVWSDVGCVVLIQWDRPVEILEEDSA